VGSVSQSVPFADYLNFSFPDAEYGHVLEHVLGYVTLSGGYQAEPGAAWLGDGKGVQFRPVDDPGRVGWLRISGGGIRAFRAAGYFDSVLAVIGDYEHKVTGMHVALDLPVESRRLLNAAYRLGKSGECRFTRKRVSSRFVRKVVVPSLYGPGNTGTVYLGNRRASVWAKVYDKRNEILDRLGVEITDDVLTLNDPGPLTRYEISLGRQVGLTLADVIAPGPVFWHHMGETLLARPGDCAAWVPGASGYYLPPREDPLPAVQLALLLERSPDLKRALKLADAIGPRGRDHLRGMLTRFVETSSVRRAAAVPR